MQNLRPDPEDETERKSYKVVSMLGNMRRRTKLFHGEFIDGMLGINVSWTKNGISKLRMVYGIRPFLGFQCQCLTVTYRLAFDLSAVRTVEKVSAIELKSRLISQYFHETSGRRVIY